MKGQILPDFKTTAEQNTSVGHEEAVSGGLATSISGGLALKAHDTQCNPICAYSEVSSLSLMQLTAR